MSAVPSAQNKDRQMDQDSMKPAAGAVATGAAGHVQSVLLHQGQSLRQRCDTCLAGHAAGPGAAEEVEVEEKEEDETDWDETSLLIGAGAAVSCSKQRQPWLPAQVPGLLRLALLMSGADAPLGMTTTQRALVWAVGNAGHLASVMFFLYDFPNSIPDVLEGLMMSCVTLFCFLSTNLGPAYVFLWRGKSFSAMLDPDGYLDHGQGNNQEFQDARRRARKNVSMIHAGAWLLTTLALSQVYWCWIQVPELPLAPKLRYALGTAYTIWHTSVVAMIIPALVVVSPLVHVEQIHDQLHRAHDNAEGANAPSVLQLDAPGVALRWSTAARMLLRRSADLSFIFAAALIAILMMLVVAAVLLFYRPREFYSDFPWMGLTDMLHYSIILVMILVPAGVIDHTARHAAVAAAMLPGHAFGQSSIHLLVRHISTCPMQLRVAGFHVTAGGVRSVALAFLSFLFGTARHMLDQHQASSGHAS